MSADLHIVGHEDAAKLLATADRNKSRSFLIEGARGIGKAKLARKFAAEVLGSNIERITSKSHPDFFSLERKQDEKTGKFKKQIAIDDARSMRDFLSRTPAEGAHRVVIIDSADELRMEAANCILKVVEEPPKNSLIILLTHGGWVLPTIRSRCTCIRVQPLPPFQMREVLQRLIPEISDDDIMLLSQFAEGSPGMAEMIYRNDGIWMINELVDIFQQFPNADYNRMAKFSERISKNEKGWEIFNQVYSWLLANLAKSRARGNESLGNFLPASNFNLPLLLDEIEEWSKLQINTDIFNLDEKQVVVNGLLNTARCWA